jgi:hypothetical protein
LVESNGGKGQSFEFSVQFFNVASPEDLVGVRLRFQVSLEEDAAFSDVMPCELVVCYQHFAGIGCPPSLG